jgi:hypothetical protein
MSSKGTCDMEKDCTNPVTHIGEKGYVYCAAHSPCRSGWERCRKMAGWERQRIAAGKVLMSYAPITKAESDRREQEQQDRAKAA